MTGELVTPETKFMAASITKTYTAAIVLDLVDDGLLALDDRVGALLPELPSNLAGISDATVGNLLAHTSGLIQAGFDGSDPTRRYARDEVLARLVTTACAPGACWSYADGNYILLGRIIEAVTARPARDVLTERLLEPLGLADTYLYGEALVPEPTAHQYGLASGHQGPIVDLGTPSTAFTTFYSTSGSMVATARDLARWADRLFGGDVLTTRALRGMLDFDQAAGLPCATPCPLPYGLGAFRYDIGGRLSYGHDGSSGAIVAYFPTERVTIPILTNGGRQATGTFLLAMMRAVPGLARDRGQA